MSEGLCPEISLWMVVTHYTWVC